MVLVGKEDFKILDEPMDAKMADIGDQPNWLNLPDLAFNEIMMMIISLHRCMQVCSSWRERITNNIWKNPSRRNFIRDRIERAIGPERFPSNEEICIAKWLSM